MYIINIQNSIGKKKDMTETEKTYEEKTTTQDRGNKVKPLKEFTNH